MPHHVMHTRRVTSFDGTDIAYHVSETNGPALVLANGLGGTHTAWRHQVDYFGDRHRILTWDYRGLYDSRRPPSDDFSVSSQARDAIAMLDREQVDAAVFVGWSMGVQVALEIAARAPSRVTHLVMLNGTFGDPFATVGFPGARFVVPAVVRGLRRARPVAAALTRRAVAHQGLLRWVKRIGLVGPTLDEETFAALARAFADLDMDAYFRTLQALGRHDASDLLERVRVPTLVIAGEHDRFTPPRLAEQMARRIRGAEITVVPGATHYAAVEYPDVVSLRIERFLNEHHRR